METYAGAKIHWKLFIAALFVIAKKLETQISPYRRMDNKLRSVHAMEYSAAIKRNEILIQEPVGESQEAGC